MIFVQRPISLGLLIAAALLLSGGRAAGHPRQARGGVPGGYVVMPLTTLFAHPLRELLVWRRDVQAALRPRVPCPPGRWNGS